MGGSQRWRLPKGLRAEAKPRGMVVKGEKMMVLPLSCSLAHGYHLFLPQSYSRSSFLVRVKACPLTHTSNLLSTTAKVTLRGVEELNSMSSNLISSFSSTLHMPSFTLCKLMGACHYQCAPSTTYHELRKTSSSDIALAMLRPASVSAYPETTTNDGSDWWLPGDDTARGSGCDVGWGCACSCELTSRSCPPYPRKQTWLFSRSMKAPCERGSDPARTGCSMDMNK